MTTIVIVFALAVLALVALAAARKRNAATPPLQGAKVVFRGGIFDQPRMQAARISRDDIEAAVRAKGLTLKEVLEVRVTADGTLVVIEDSIGIANRRASSSPVTEI